MKPARLNWIDYSRGIAIILVTYRHVFEGIKESGIAVQHYMFLEYANIFFYSFRMPLFFIISGIFVSRSLSKRGFRKFAATRARTILYPYFLWGFLQLSLQMIFTKYTNGHPTASAYLDLFFLPREIAQFWYLYALFNVSVLYAMARHLLHISAKQNIMIGLVFFYLSALIYQHNINTGFVIDILHNYIFFAIGDLVSRYLLDKKNYANLESGKLFLIMIAPFTAAQVYFLSKNIQQAAISKYMFVEYYQPFAFLLIALTGCTFIISLTFYLQKKDALKWLPALGRYSLYIYVAHVITFAFLRIVLSKFLGIQNVPILLTSGILAGLSVPVLLYKLAERWNMRWLFTLEKDKETDSINSISANQVQILEK